MTYNNVFLLDKFDVFLDTKVHLVFAENLNGNITVLTTSYYKLTLPLFIFRTKKIEVIQIFELGTTISKKNIYCCVPTKEV